MLQREAWIVVILFICCLPRAFAQKQISGTFEGELSYSFLIPAGYDEPGKKFPLMLHLGSAPIELTSVLRGNEYPAFLLAPSSGGQGWASSSESLGFRSSLVVQLMEQLESEYESIDTERRFITGWSNGGFGTFDMIAKRPDLFDAAIPIGSGYDPKRVAPNVRTWAFHGRGDGIVNVFGTRIMVDAIQEAGGAPLYLEMAQQAHEIRDDVLSMPEVYDWLFHETPPAIANLIYNPQSGNLKLDAEPDSMWSFSLASEVDLEQILIADIDGTAVTNSNNRLKYQATIDTEFDGVVDLGDLLPTGLNYTTFHEAIRTLYKPTGQTANRDFLVRIVPEPRQNGMLAVIVLLGSVALNRRPARRQYHLRRCHR